MRDARRQRPGLQLVAIIVAGAMAAAAAITVLLGTGSSQPTATSETPRSMALPRPTYTGPVATATTGVDRPSAGEAGPAATATLAAAVAPTAGLIPVSGLTFPIQGACLPASDSVIPGAPRDYRNGTHEGVDFYGSGSCTAIGLGTEVLAAAEGTVIRADRQFEDLTEDSLADVMQRVQEEGGDDPDVLDVFRGRQVWIDHGAGVVTRYAHLSGVAEGIVEGIRVSAGQLIAYVGESGTPSSVTAPGSEMHLHFEIRVGGTYLGAGLDAASVRRLYKAAFAP